jgi:hypothetical protein
VDAAARSLCHWKQASFQRLSATPRFDNRYYKLANGEETQTAVVHLGRCPPPRAPTKARRADTAGRGAAGVVPGAAAGKVVRIIDAGAAPLPPAIPDFNPAIDGIYERAMFERMRDDYLNALSNLARASRTCSGLSSATPTSKAN